jgi:glutamate formiminotransferase
MRILERAPNISEGVNIGIIHKIIKHARDFSDAQILSAGPDRGADRTVVTMAGTPKEVYK